MIPSPTARTRQREQGALKDKGIDLMVMPEGLSCLHVTMQLHARYPNADRAGP